MMEMRSFLVVRRLRQTLLQRSAGVLQRQARLALGGMRAVLARDPRPPVLTGLVPLRATQPQAVGLRAGSGVRAPPLLP